MPSGLDYQVSQEVGGRVKLLRAAKNTFLA